MKLIQDKSGSKSKQEEGLEMLRKAAEKGSVNAMVQLGDLLKRSGKLSSAFKYIEMAHEKGK